MDFSLTTPAIFFPAISLLLLAYNNRFLALATLIRSLHSQYRQDPNVGTYHQIRALRKRLGIIRNMQAFGIGGLLGCVVCIFILFLGYQQAGEWLFILSLFLLMLSLIFSLREIWVSVGALNIQLKDLEEARDIRK